MDAHLRVCKHHVIGSLDDYKQNDEDDLEIVLYGCGMQFINGTYRTYHPIADERGSGYFKVTHHRSQVKKVVLWHCNDGRWCIYMVDNGLSFMESLLRDILYTTVGVHNSPPTDEANWIVETRLALDPPPRVMAIKQEPD